MSSQFCAFIIQESGAQFTDDGKKVGSNNFLPRAHMANTLRVECWRLEFCDWGASMVSFRWGPFSWLADDHLLLRPHVMERGCLFLEGLVLPAS